MQGQTNPTPASIFVNTPPSKRQLFQTFRKMRKLLIVYGGQNAKILARYREVAEGMQNNSRWVQVTIKTDESVTEQELQEYPLLLIGTPQSNLVIARISSQLPFQLDAKAIIFDGKKYTEPSTVMALPFYPYPLHPSLPMTLFTGLNDGAILDLLSDPSKGKGYSFLWSSWGYELYQNNNRMLLGLFDNDTWEFSRNRHYDFRQTTDTLKETTHFLFIAHTKMQAAELGDFTQNCEEAVEKIKDFTDNCTPFQKINYHLFGSAEEKGLMLQNTSQAHLDFQKHEVYTVLNETYRNNFIGKENELLIRQKLGKPKTIALERGLAIYFTKHWQIKGYDYWAMKLFRSGNLVPLPEILDNDWQEKGSMLLLGCLSASFVEFLIHEFGKEIFLKNYASWIPAKGELGKLEKAWKSYLSDRATKVRLERKMVNIPYLKGFNFAHEGYSVYNGYISEMATNTLNHLHDLGANSVAIVPYSFIRDPQKPSFLSIPKSPGSENDESVIHSAAMAKKIGMSVLLKPQIWVGRGSWTGDISMQNEADWQSFFKNYQRWILHYALLAEIHEIDMLCIGVELVKTSNLHEAEWREIIRKTRGLYSGKLTYAANWGEEFEQIRFWDELDFIGLDCYYPLSKAKDASDKELEEGFKKVVSKIKKISGRFHKPLVFTEIGFRSKIAPWVEPHAGNRSEEYNGEHQKRCYEIVFKSIENQSWCRGILWWKYPSQLSPEESKNATFSPDRKPAERVVQKWFGKLPD